MRIDADAEPMERGAVVIEDGRIREIVAQSRLPREGDARVIDAGGLTVVPGFVDAHLHVTTEGAGRLHEEVDKPADEATAQGERNLANALSWGVTTVRDAGSWNDVVLGLRDRIARGALVAPRVLPCGAPVTTPRGHLWWFGGEAQGLDAVRAVVRRQAQLGMTHVKVMSTGGWATKGSDPRVPQFSQEEMSAITDEARANGIQTMAHIASIEGVRRAVVARIDTLEHCMTQQPDNSWVYPDELLRAIVAQRFWIDPTPAWHYRTVQSPPPGTSPARVADLRETRAARMEIYKRLIALGHDRWLTGTDTGGTNPQDYFPLVCEIMVKDLGLSPRAVLRAATSDAARALRLERETGALRPGLAADLVAMEGDPVEDIMSVWKVRLTVARGQAVEYAGGPRTLATSRGGGWE